MSRCIFVACGRDPLAVASALRFAAELALAQDSGAAALPEPRLDPPRLDLSISVSEPEEPLALFWRNAPKFRRRRNRHG